MLCAAMPEMGWYECLALSGVHGTYSPAFCQARRMESVILLGMTKDEGRRTKRILVIRPSSFVRAALVVLADAERQRLSVEIERGDMRARRRLALLQRVRQRFGAQVGGLRFDG